VSTFKEEKRRDGKNYIRIRTHGNIYIETYVSHHVDKAPEEPLGGDSLVQPWRAPRTQHRVYKRRLTEDRDGDSLEHASDGGKDATPTVLHHTASHITVQASLPL
jgi:hypothetical protein